MKMMRRIGPDPHVDGDPTPAASGCPDIWELDNGDIGIIGVRITHLRDGTLPDGVSCGTDEEIVRFPRQQLIRASDAIAKLR